MAFDIKAPTQVWKSSLRGGGPRKLENQMQLKFHRHSVLEESRIQDGSARRRRSWLRIQIEDDF